MSTPIGHDRLSNRYRELLGEQRAARIAAGAEEVGATLAARDGRRLRLARGVLDDPLDTLDRDGAKEALALEGMRAVTEETLGQARARKGIAALESISHRPAGAAERGEEAARQEAPLERLLAELEARDAGLRAAGTHPEDWMARDGERAARVLAFEREIGERDALDTGRARWDAKTADPLHPYRDALGPDVAAELERRAEPLRSVMARQDPETVAAWRRELERPSETIPGDLVETGRLRKDREALERRVLDLDAQAVPLEETGYKPELAVALRSEQGRSIERLQEVEQRQSALWESQRAPAEEWLDRNGSRAALSIAVEGTLVNQVEQQMQQRELGDGGYSY